MPDATVEPPAVWVLSQSWRHVLFAHWPVDTARLRRLVPPPLELDLFENQGWVGLAALIVSDSRAFSLVPLPVPGAFAEVNVRTYVRDRGRPGVYFLTLQAASAAAVALGRGAYSLPYCLSEGAAKASRGRVEFSSRRRLPRREAAFAARYWPLGRPRSLSRGTLARWLIERRHLFTVDSTGRVLGCEVEHKPWLVAKAHAEISANTVPAACAVRLPAIAPMAHYAERQEVRISQPRLLS